MLDMIWSQIKHWKKTVLENRERTPYTYKVSNTQWVWSVAGK